MDLMITLLATNIYQAECFQESFKNYSFYTNVHLGRFEEINNIDCLVSPANSFGIMDGGMDGAITNFFGVQLQKNVQQVIIKEFYGEQPIGTSFIIETNNKRIPYLAHTPTMRIPKPINGTENVYQATKASLIAAIRHGAIKSIALPAFGAGTGKVHAYKVAEQMALAVKHILNPPQSLDWNFATIRDYEILGRI